MPCDEYRQRRIGILLGNEIKETQENLAQIQKFVGEQMKTLEPDLLENKGTLACMHYCHNHMTQNMFFAQKIRDYIGQLDSLYTNIKWFRAAFYAYGIALFFTTSSLAAGYVTPQFLLPA